MKRNAKTITVLTMAILLTAIMLTGCGEQVTFPRPVPAEGAAVYEPTGRISAHVENGVLTVDCETDIMNGAIIAVTVDGIDGTNYETQAYTKSSDSFYAEFTVAEDWPDTVHASLVCTPSSHGKQSDEVTDAYGKKLENLSGDNVLWNNDGCFFAVQTEAIDIR